MRVSLGASALVYPMVVFIIGTYDEEGQPSAMNAAWGGTAGEKRISICVDRTHKTTLNFLKTRAFTVSIGTKERVAECDYIGLVSQAKVKDKFSKAGFHAIKSSLVDAPIIQELPLCLECKVLSYDESTELLLGEIVGVSADESILDSKGKIDLSKLHPITFDTSNHKYIALGECVGDAFSIGKKLM